MRARTLLLLLSIAGAPVLAMAGSCARELTLSPVLAAANPRMPHSGTQQRENKASWAQNSACIACHQEEAHTWQSSRHALAGTNSAFQAALQREPAQEQEFCLSCHAPERPRGEPRQTEKVSQGVSCVTCHITDGAGVLATFKPRRPSQSRAESPHPVVRDVLFSTSAACKNCHEFEFPQPGRIVKDPRHGLMQRTWSEHEQGAKEGIECASCHLPLRNGRRAHTFVGGYDEELVRGSLNSSATLNQNGLHLKLVPQGVTHAIPTGDLFRRLRIRMRLFAAEKLIKECEHFLARHFGKDRYGLRIEIADDRIHGAERLLSCSPPHGQTADKARYEIIYERVAELPVQGDEGALMESSFVLEAEEVK